MRWMGCLEYRILLMATVPGFIMVHGYCKKGEGWGYRCVFVLLGWEQLASTIVNRNYVL